MGLFHKLIIKTDIVRNLVLLLDQVQLRHHTGVIFEVLLSYLEQLFNRVLNSSFDLAIMENVSESLKDCIDTCWGGFCKYLATINEKFSSQFNRVFGWLFKVESKNLEGQQFMNDLLVNQVSYELKARLAGVLVIPSVSLLKLNNDSVDHYLHVLWEFSVDCGKQSGIYRSKKGTRSLGLHDGFCQQTLATD